MKVDSFQSKTPLTASQLNRLVNAVNDPVISVSGGGQGGSSGAGAGIHIEEQTTYRSTPYVGRIGTAGPSSESDFPGGSPMYWVDLYENTASAGEHEALTLTSSGETIAAIYPKDAFDADRTLSSGDTVVVLPTWMDDDPASMVQRWIIIALVEGSSGGGSVPPGGIIYQVLTKVSSTNADVTWDYIRLHS